MTKAYKDITGDILTYMKEIRKETPALSEAFMAMNTAAFGDGEVEKKTKEMIALAIGVATHCDGCIGFHAKALVKLGATRKEVAEVLGVAVQMGGGPAMMYAADALRAYDEFAAG